MKVLVTGGAGFIGANLCRRLVGYDRVSEVIVLDDLSSGEEDNLSGCPVEFVRGSILDPDVLDLVCDGASAIVHLAARPSVPRSVADPVASHQANATGTLQVLEAARRAGNLHVIVASSSSVYGSNPVLPKHEGLLTAPLSPYAASKLATESYALAWGNTFGMDVLAFRFFNVFGPMQSAGHAYAAVIPAFLEAALAGRPLPVHGDGLQTRDFTFVDSVTAVIADAVVRRLRFDGPVNLAFGGRASLLDVIAILEQIIGHALPRQHTPSRAGDVRDSQADQTRFRSLFPDLQPVDLVEGLHRTVAYFQESSVEAR